MLLHKRITHKKEPVHIDLYTLVTMVTITITQVYTVLYHKYHSHSIHILSNQNNFKINQNQGII